MKIVTFKAKETGGVAYYRHIKPIEYLKQFHEVIELEQTSNEETLNKALYNADLLYICSPMGLPMLELVCNLIAINQSELNLCKAGTDKLEMSKIGLSNKKLNVWIDYDDDVWNVSPFSEHYRIQGRREFMPVIKGRVKKIWKDGLNGFDIASNIVNIKTKLHFLKLADVVTTPSLNLVRKFKRFNKGNVILFPNGLDGNVWEEIKKEHKDMEEIRILWTLSNSHLPDWLNLEKPLSEVLNHYPKVKLITVGQRFNSKHINWKKREHYEWLPSVDKYALFIKGLNCDIGIGHVTKDRFNVYKSPLKACEYGRLGIASILSGQLYSSYINEKEAVVYYTKAEFKEGLTRLITDYKLRQSLSDNLQTKVRNNYLLNITGDNLNTELLKVVLNA